MAVEGKRYLVIVSLPLLAHFDRHTRILELLVYVNEEDELPL